MSAGSLLTVFMDMLLSFVPMKFAFLGIKPGTGLIIWCRVFLFGAAFPGIEHEKKTQMLLGPWLFSFQHLPG